MALSRSGKFKICLCAGLAVLVIAAGGFIRLAQNNPNPFLTNNVISYYFDISKQLNITGQLSQIDKWRFAPGSAVENAPPFLAYFTVCFYKLLSIFASHLSFLMFSFFLPPLIFFIWAIGGFFLVERLFRSYWPSFIFVVLLSFLPVSVELTKFGHYTEEFLGAFLIFWSFLFFLLWDQEKKKIFLGLCFASLVFLVLTWQQFHLIYGILILTALFRIKEKKSIFGFLFLILGSFFISQGLAMLWRSAYSPLSMIREAYLGIIGYNSEFIQIAMKRSDWKDLSFWEAVKSFDLLGWFFWLTGLVFVIFHLKIKPNLTIFIANLAVLAVVIFFVKSRFLALPFFLILGAIGGKVLFEEKSIWLKLENNFGKLIQKIKAGALLKIVFIILVGFFIFKSDWFFKPANLPAPEIDFYRISQAGGDSGAYRVGIRIINKGDSGLKEKSAFSGLHIEVENAEIKDIQAYSPYTNSAFVIKPDAQRGNIYWFEAKYDFLDKNQWGRAEFTIIPKEKPVNIWYRGWIPGSCSLIERLKFFNQLSANFRDFFANSWRSENCIVRLPSNNSGEAPFCQVKVFAAHQEQQNFHCLEKSLDD